MDSSTTTIGGDTPVPTGPRNSAPPYLLVMHDFTARSSDELSLRKGETVELIADDSEFGDGWYLGRCLATDNKGLFPQAYTTPIIVDNMAIVNPSTLIQGSAAANALVSSPISIKEPNETIGGKVNEPSLSFPLPIPEEPSTLDPQMPPLVVGKVSKTTTSVTNEKSITILGEHENAGPQPANSSGHGMVSVVVEDTLSDIEEAISEISARNNKILRYHNQRHSAATPSHHATRQDLQDSSSEYSRHGELEESSSELEEEPSVTAVESVDISFTVDEVHRWSPADVAKYLRSRNVTPSTCSIFEEQEISGVILVQLQMSDLKELDLGSFGKRFEVWKEIEHLLDNLQISTRPRSRSESKSMPSRISRGSPSVRSSSVGRTILPRIKSQHDQSKSHPQDINIEEPNSLLTNSATQPHGIFTTFIADSPTSTLFERPRSPPLSPAKMLQGTHRRMSGSNNGVDASRSSLFGLHTASATGSAILGGGSHSRSTLFEKSWIPSSLIRPSTSAGTTHKSTVSSGTSDSVSAGDSGFSGSRSHTPKLAEKTKLSGVELQPKEHLVMHKSAQTNHSRKSSYTEEHRVRTGTAHSRHSRVGSVDTLRGDSSAPVTSPTLHNVQGKRSTSDSITTTNFQGAKLPSVGQSIDTDQPSPPRGRVGSPESVGSVGKLEKKLSSPSTTGTTASDPRPKSERESKERSVSESQTWRAITGCPETRKKSGKKGTSAYLEGLRSITPFEAAKEGDFSGWMQKRGSGNMGTWKPRFFVLHGRRLSYFYSENDTKERGLIDVTSHKVLAATEDRFVNLQASIAAVTSPSTSPTSTAASPAFYQSLNSPSGDMSNAEGSPALRTAGLGRRDHSKEKGWFTFKLVPPAPGASKGVTFTPPRLHYFATDSKEVGRAWMAAIMKATIEIDPNSPVKTSYSAATISLAKARAIRARPPEVTSSKASSKATSLSEQSSMGLAISGVDLDTNDADVEENGEDGKSMTEARTPANAGANGMGSAKIFEGGNSSNIFLEEGSEGGSLGSGSLRSPSLERLLAGDSKDESR